MQLTTPAASSVARPNTLDFHIDDAVRLQPTLAEICSSLQDYLISLDRPQPACPAVLLDTDLLEALLDGQLRQVSADGHHVSRKALLVFLPSALHRSVLELCGSQPQLFNGHARDLLSSTTYLEWRSGTGPDARALWLPVPDLGSDVWLIESGWAWVPVVMVTTGRVACGGYFVEAEEVLYVQAHLSNAASMDPRQVYTDDELAKAQTEMDEAGPTPWFRAPFRLEDGTLMVGATELRHRMPD